MNKKTIFSLILGILFILIVGFFIYENNIKNNSELPSGEETSTISIDDTERVINGNEVENRIDILRKRLSLKGLIQDGDIHFENEEYTRALTKFLQVNKQNPNDESIIHKIGEIYFQIHKYSQSYKYFSQIKEYPLLNKDIAIKSYLFSNEIKIENKESIKNTINSFDLSDQEKFYYNTSIDCTIDFKDCRQKYNDYFANRTLPLTGSGEVIKDNLFADLENIYGAIENYRNFQLDDISYKGALISGAYFQNQLYPIAIKTAEEVLKESPDYRPLIKIIAKSYYEMGNYVDAKKFAIQYNGLGDKDPEISYFLGIIHQKLREYTRSTIQLRKAIQLGYENGLDVNRRLLYNYYQLGDTDKMLNVFQEMIQDNIENITAIDMSLAIFYHILNEKINQAETYTAIALKKFPNEEVFYGYEGWLLLQDDELNDEILNKAEKSLEKGLAINDKNPMISLTLGQLEEKRGNTKKAFIYYKQTISLDQGGEYEKFAKEKLETLEIE